MTTSTTYAQVAQLLQQARSMKALEEVAQLIQRVGGFDEQNRLGLIFKARMVELKGV